MSFLAVKFILWLIYVLPGIAIAFAALRAVPSRQIRPVVICLLLGISFVWMITAIFLEPALGPYHSRIRMGAIWSNCLLSLVLSILGLKVSESKVRIVVAGISLSFAWFVMAAVNSIV